MFGLRYLRPRGVLPLLRHPRTLLAGSFLAVAGTIVANGLFMQPRQHPAPFFVTREGALEKTLPELRRADDLVLAVQSALRRTGYYSGALDGISGPQTQSAILAFERAAGRRETGEASLDLLAALRAAKAEDASSLMELAATPREDRIAALAEPEPDPRVAAVQHALAIAAYGPVHADGIPGPETRDAIARFQRDHGLPITGEISDGLILELRTSGALDQ